MFSAPRKEHLTLDGALLTTEVANATIQVNSAEKHQTMLGFGGSPCIPTYAEMNDAGKKAYWEILRRYNLLLDREYPMGSELKPDLSNMDNLSDATPHYYGDNFPNGEVSDFEYSKHALALGGEVIYEMWALPSWATQPYTPEGKPIIDAWGKPVLKAAKVDEYARIVVGYCKLAKQRTGQPPAIVGIQNEVEQPHEVFQQMVLTLRRELDKAGFQSVKIHMADAPYMYMAVDRAKVLQQNPEAWKDIDYTAAHEYDFQKNFTDPDKYDAVMSDMHQTSARQALPRHRNLHQRRQIPGALLPHRPKHRPALPEKPHHPRRRGPHVLLAHPRHRATQLRWLPLPAHPRQDEQLHAHSLKLPATRPRRLQPPRPKGMTRVSTTSNNPDLLTTAFEDAHHATLIILNRSTTPQRLNIQWTAKHWTQVERTSQTAENATSAITPSDLIVEPGEILTLSNFEVN